MSRLLLAALCAVYFVGGTARAEEKESQELTVGQGRYLVVPVKGKIKRVAIADQNTADVTVLQDGQLPKKAPKAKVVEVRSR